MDKILNCLTELRPEFDFTKSNNFIEDNYTILEKVVYNDYKNYYKFISFHLYFSISIV